MTEGSAGGSEGGAGEPAGAPSGAASQGDGRGHQGAGRLSRAAPWVGLLVAAAVLVAHATHFDFINDDAFISFRYADNLVQHGELTYNPGERCEGYTNFLWTMIIAAVLWLGGDPVPWSKGLGVLLGLGTLAATFAFARRWSRRHHGPSAGGWAAAAPLFLAMSPSFAAWTEGGLETSLFTALVTVGALRSIVELRDPERAPWSGLVLALAAMTRPDGLLIAGLIGLLRGAESALRRRALLPERRDWIWLALFLAAFGPYWIWRFGYYGFAFPNTFYAKADGALWEPGLRYVGGFLRDCHAWIALPLLALPWPGPRGGWRIQATAAIVAIPFMIYVARVGGDFMALHRFLVPLMPLLAVAAQEGIASFWIAAEQRQGERGGGGGDAPSAWRRARVAAALALAVALLGWHGAQKTSEALEVGSDRGVDSIGWLKQFVDQTTQIGLYLRGAYPPETTLATTAAGVIPYYSRMRTLDLLALNDVHVAHEVPATGPRPGHGKSAPEPYVLQWRPDLLIRHPRMSATPPQPSPSERRYWAARNYKFMHARVPGLDPPYWAWFESIE